MTGEELGRTLDPAAVLALSRRTDPHGVLSIYVDVQPGAGYGSAAIDLKNRLSELERRIEAQGPPERWRALRNRLRQLAPEIEMLTSLQRSGRGRALFAPLDSEEVIRFSSQLPLPNRVVLDSGAFIHPLLELLDEGRPAGVVLASQDAAELLEWQLGELHSVSRLEPEETEAPHERSGPVGSGALGTRRPGPVREQRQARRREQTMKFVQQVAAEAARLAGERGWERLLVSGGEHLTEPLLDELSSQRLSLVGEPRTLINLEPAELTAEVTRVLGEDHRAREASLVREAAEAARGGRGALGLSEVAAALNEDRVAHLIYDPEVRYQGSISGDGQLYAAGETPPGDDDLIDEPRFTERLVERALETGARVTPAEGAASILPEADGIVATLRW